MTSGQHRLEPLLEFAAIFRAGNHRPHVERQELLVLQALRHVAVDDAQSKPLDDRGLADAGLADQHGIVFGPARQHLNRSADFLVTADDRIELAVSCSLSEITRIFLERIVGIFGRCGIRSAALAQGFDRRVQGLRRDTGLAQDFSGFVVLLEGESEQKPLNGDKAVAGLFAGLLGGIENARQSRIEIDLAGAAARHARALRQRRFGRGQRLA